MRTHKQKICLNCKELKPILARGLCIKCYRTLSKNRQLVEFPVIGHEKCKNIYAVKDDIMYLKIISLNNNDKTAFFSTSHYPEVKQYQWRCLPDDRVFTIVNKKTTYLHHIITGRKASDHIDRNPLNNLDNNLRMATKQQNGWNCSLSKRNSSGVTGVSFCGDKWVAELRCGEIRHRKRCHTKEEAIATRLIFEKEYLGEYAPQKHLSGIDCGAVFGGKLACLELPSMKECYV